MERVVFLIMKMRYGKKLCYINHDWVYLVDMFGPSNVEVFVMEWGFSQIGSE